MSFRVALMCEGELGVRAGVESLRGRVRRTERKGKEKGDGERGQGEEGEGEKGVWFSEVLEMRVG